VGRPGIPGSLMRFWSCLLKEKTRSTAFSAPPPPSASSPSSPPPHAPSIARSPPRMPGSQPSAPPCRAVSTDPRRNAARVVAQRARGRRAHLASPPGAHLASPPERAPPNARDALLSRPLKTIMQPHRFFSRASDFNSPLSPDTTVSSEMPAVAIRAPSDMAVQPLESCSLTMVQLRRG